MRTWQPLEEFGNCERSALTLPAQRMAWQIEEVAGLEELDLTALGDDSFVSDFGSSKLKILAFGRTAIEPMLVWLRSEGSTSRIFGRQKQYRRRAQAS